MSFRTLGLACGAHRPFASASGQRTLLEYAITVWEGIRALRSGLPAENLAIVATMNEDAAFRFARRLFICVVIFTAVGLAVSPGTNLGLRRMIWRITDRMKGPMPDRAIRGNLKQLQAAANEFKRKNGRYPVSLEEFVGPGNIMNQVVSVAGEDYSKLKFGGDLVVQASGGRMFRQKAANK